MRAVTDTALELLAPASCAACDAPLGGGPGFCASCEVGISPRDPSGCVACPAVTGPSGACEACERRLSPLRLVVAPFEYEGAIASALQRYKYEGRDDLAAPILTRWLWELRPGSAPRTTLGRLAEVGDWIAPVPLHRARLRQRGFDQAWLLARGLGQALDLPAAPRLLRRERATPPQVGLGRVAREANVNRAFTADPKVKGRHLLLVDDVLTTGSTLRACAEALTEAGAASVVALVVARAHP